MLGSILDSAENDIFSILSLLTIIVYWTQLQCNIISRYLTKFKPHIVQQIVLTGMVRVKVQTFSRSRFKTLFSKKESRIFFIILNLVNAHMNFAVDLQKIAAIENDFKRLGTLNNNYVNRELNLMSPDSTNTRTKRRHYISMLARDSTYGSLKKQIKFYPSK